MNRQKIIIYVLSILLLISVSYITVDKIQESLRANEQQSFQDGYNQGMTAAVVALYQQTENCLPTTINIGNITRHVIDTSCLANILEGKQG